MPAVPREAVGLPHSAVDLVPPYKAILSGDFQRIHIHLEGLTGIFSKRKNRFGGVKWFDAVADPYCIVTAITNDKDANILADYFPVHKHTFPVIHNSQVWDCKGTVLCRNTESLKFVVLDKNRKRSDEVLMEVTVTNLPEAVKKETVEEPGKWTEYRVKPDKVSVQDDQEMELVFRLKITNDWFVSPQDTAALTKSTKLVEYSEHVISSTDSGSTPDDNALLQCWKHKDNKSKAVLWVLGRNDCFMHPHVAKHLFSDYDIYCLNYSMNGCCRKRGWVTDAHWNSHNKYGDFNIYCSQISQAVAIMEKENYDTVLGYAHSTGGPVLLNYLMTNEANDDIFDGFLFNSPFLDWGFVGGDMVEYLLENVQFLEKVGMLSLDGKLGTAVTPDELKETPIQYLGEEVVLCPWAAKIWAQYHFDWASRPLYKVPMTGGFAKGVTAVHTKMEQWYKKHKPITTKPFLCITSRGDDVLKSQETVSRADWIGPNRCEVELNDNSHDIFLSQDIGDTVLAIDMCKAWMKSRDFL